VDPTVHRASVRAVGETLARYRERARRELLRSLPSREPRRYLYDLLPDYPLRGGKGLRPAICIAACRAFGGTEESAMPAAVSLELLHTAFLIHDDIQDGSDSRRGRPSLHERHGTALALNVGDALAFLSLEPLLEDSRRQGAPSHEVLAEFQEMVRQTLEGQAIELGWIRDNVAGVTYDDYLRMATQKTSWYTTIAPLRLGALLGARRRLDPGRFDRLGFFLGALFQIQDDLADLEDGESTPGLRPSADIVEGKRTLMLIHLLSAADPPDRLRVRHLLAGERTDSDAAEIRALMLRYGSIEFGRECARAMATAADRELVPALGDLPDSTDRRFLAGLPRYLLRGG
jgi:geranylgeranyl diphosphate synthase type II